MGLETNKQVKVKLFDEIIRFCLHPRKYLFRKKMERKLHTDPALLARVLDGEELVMPPSIPTRMIRFVLNHGTFFFFLFVIIGFTILIGYQTLQTIDTLKDLQSLEGLPGSVTALLLIILALLPIIFFFSIFRNFMYDTGL